MTLDTACSSSLYALHLACQAIHFGDCSAAIVAGSNLILTPECQIFSSALGAVSPTSKCHTFDASADGYARADGIGAIYIKRISDAVESGDPIRGVIRGTATNANGKTGGITRPSSDGQESVIRLAYERACIDYSKTGYFECHGTGTSVGDPLEVAAIGRVFGDTRSKKAPLLLGSVKTNLGHCEPVSGIAGLMKVVLAMEHDLIPPTVGIVNINPALDLMNGSLKVVTQSTRWPASSHQIASVNSFGYGGSNSHAIIESASSYFGNLNLTKPSIIHGSYELPSNTSPMGADRDQHPTSREDETATTAASETLQDLRSHFLLVFSAHNAITLNKNIDAIAEVCTNYRLIDFAHTLGVRGSEFSEKWFTVANNATIKTALSGERVIIHNSKRSHAGKIGFVFTGQGAQWAQMGIDLSKSFPSFRSTLRTLDRYLHSLDEPPEWFIEEVLEAPAEISKVHMGHISQPLTTAIQIALVDLLASWNISPAVNIGHSSGEIAAAYSSGLLTSREAIIVALLRGKVLKHNPRKGAMLAVNLGEKDFRKIISQENGRASIACFNSPTNITVSGNVDEIMTIKGTLDSNGVLAKVLSTDGNAYHSSHMQLLGQKYEDDIRRYCPTLSDSSRRSSKKPFVSSLTGKLLSNHGTGASYWKDNLVSPVKFGEALETLSVEVPVDVVVEVGPHSALRGPIQQSLGIASPERSIQYLATLTRKDSGVYSLLRTAGHLWLADIPVNLRRINAIETGNSYPEYADRYSTGNIITDLPRYQWHYMNTLFFENRWTREWRLRTHSRHDILGSQIPGLSKSGLIWRNVLRTKDLEWVADHSIGGAIIFPAGGYIGMAIEAASQAHEDDGGSIDQIHSFDLRDVIFDKALIVPGDDHGIETFLTQSPIDQSGIRGKTAHYRFLITSVASHEYSSHSTNHVSGFVSIISRREENKKRRDLGILPDQGRKVSSNRWYERFAEAGMEFGPRFRLLSDIKDLNGAATAEIAAFTPVGESRYALHPTELDAALQLCIIVAHIDRTKRFDTPFMPQAIQRASIVPRCEQATGEQFIVTANGHKTSPRGLNSGFVIIDPSKAFTMTATGVHFISPEESNRGLKSPTRPFSRMPWVPDIGSLTSDTIIKLHPPAILGESATSAQLERLALHQLIHFRVIHQELFESKVAIEPHLRRLLQWIDEHTNLAIEGHHCQGREIIEYSSAKREAIIETFSSSLCNISSEARLSCHIYENLPAILQGKKSGIQVALEDDRLSMMYKDAHRVVEGNRRLASIVALAALKTPQLNILEVGAGTGSATNEILRALHGNSISRMCNEYLFTDITPSFLSRAEDRFKEFQGVGYATFDFESRSDAEKYEAAYDLVIASNAVHATSDILQALRNIRKTLRVGGKLMLLEITQAPLNTGILLGTFSDFWKGEDDPNYPRHGGPFISKSTWAQVLPQAGFTGLDFALDDYAGQSSCTVVVASAAGVVEINDCLPCQHHSLSLIYRADPVPPFVLGFKNFLQSQSTGVDLVCLTNYAQPLSRNIIALSDVDSPLLDQIDSMEWKGVQRIFNDADAVLWITNGDLLTGGDPRFAIIDGLGRGLRTERQSMRITHLDLDLTTACFDKSTFRLFKDLAERNTTPLHAGYESDYLQKDGVTYIRRLLSDNRMNQDHQFHPQLPPPVSSGSLKDLEDVSLQADFGSGKSAKTVLFQEVAGISTYERHEDMIEVDIRALGISHHNAAGLLGKMQTSTFADECAGTVKQVGRDVQSLSPRDEIYCPVFGSCGNRAMVPASWCQLMSSEDSYAEMSTMSVAFCTALYALSDLASVKHWETILVIVSTSSIGLACLQAAALHGANAFAMVHDHAGKRALLESKSSILEANILESSDSSFMQSIKDATKGVGFDIVIAGQALDPAYDYRDFLAPFGRVVELRRSNEARIPKISVNLPEQNTSNFTFDIELLSKLKPERIARLMDQVQSLRKQNLIVPLPHQTFHASKLTAALETCYENPSTSNLVLSYAKTDEKLEFRQMVTQSSFDPDSDYLLVGCLGDLGQIFSRWMVQRGARHLTFLSRSGCSNVEIKTFLSELRTMGAVPKAVHGDVSCLADVQRAIRSCIKPIKGVVQGALALKDRLFEGLTHEMFTTLINTRVVGTINLHTALRAEPLQFFQMWSSWTAIFGTVAQSNYLATCTFMDAFTRHRRHLSLPAVSLNLSQIFDAGTIRRIAGHETGLTRNGLYGTEAYDFLRYCDVAISSSTENHGSPHLYDPFANAQLLAGIEPVGLKNLSATYPLEDMSWCGDLHFSHLLQATRNLTAQDEKAVTDIESLASDASAADRIVTKLAQLLYVSKADIQTTRPITEYGLDSMIAAELRSWIFRNFAKDVSLFHILDTGTSVEKLEQMVTSEH